MKNNIKLSFMLFLIAFFMCSSSFGQGLDFTNENLSKIGSPIGEGMIKFHSNLNLAPEDFFEKYKSAFKLSDGEEMKLVRKEEDNLGYTHYRYQQIYKGLKVEGGQFILHSNDDKLIKGNGKIASNLKINVLPVISSTRALAIAKEIMPAQVYLWEDEVEESNLKSIKNDPFATYFPSPELLISFVNVDNDEKNRIYRLAYKVEIGSKKPFDRKAIYIDAESGELLKEIPLIIDCMPGQGCTLYNSPPQQDIDTETTSGGFRLFDDCRGDGIHTWKFGDLEIIDADNNWTDANQCPGVSAHWGLERTYDYFLETHSRNSYDNEGAMINAFVENGTDNAFWDSDLLTLNFGTGGGSFTTDDLVSLDIVGHEFSHALTQFSAGLIYSGESGGLNESFSDIFGTAVEFFVEGATANYHIAEDMWIVDGYLRSMMNPKAKTGTGPNVPSPDTYLGEFWSPVINVHYSSGIQNFWFYLLSEGSALTDEVNDNGDVFSIAGIGRSNAEAIAYRNLTVYLTPSSNFSDARAGAIQAAIDIFGECSFELIETAAAWDAVGVYGVPGCNCETDIVHSGNIASDDYASSNSITSTGTIVSSANVTYSAGNFIILNPGFIAQEASFFHAFIADCTGLQGENPQSLSALNQPTTTIAENRVEPAPSILESSLKNTPNPFSQVTTIKFELQESTQVQLEVYDLSGRLITSLINNEVMGTGIHTIDFNGQGLTNGVYIYRLSTDKETLTQKMVLNN